MLPLIYQTSTSSQRKEIVKTISNGFNSVVKGALNFPKIKLTLEAGNVKKNQLLNLVITQMYSNDFNLINSFSAVEENI